MATPWELESPAPPPYYILGANIRTIVSTHHLEQRGCRGVATPHFYMLIGGKLFIINKIAFLLNVCYIIYFFTRNKFKIKVQKYGSTLNN